MTKAVTVLYSNPLNKLHQLECGLMESHFQSTFQTRLNCARGLNSWGNNVTQSQKVNFSPFHLLFECSGQAISQHLFRKHVYSWRKTQSKAMRCSA